MYKTSNYLFATYLQTEECGKIDIKKVEKIKPGRAYFYFDITSDQAEEYKLKFHKSICLEFEEKRKKTISLAFD
jgi:hypothetical protein